MEVVGTKLTVNDRSVAPLDRVTAAPAPRSESFSKQQSATNVTLSAIVAELSSAPPVDYERVAKIRQAIADRTYPILAETIADRLIALKLNWNPNDAA